jgi:hypothetical protein
MTTPDKANEAGLKAAAQRPNETAQQDLGRVEVLAKHGRAARILAKAEAKRVEAEASAKAQDAEAERRIRTELAQLEAQAHKAVRKEEEAVRKAAARSASQAKIATWATGMLAQVRSEAAASYAGFIYLVVVTVAVGSQFVLFKGVIEDNESLSTLHGVASLAAFLAAVFIEGFGLAFYATSVASRLRGRGGWLPRIAAWAVTAFAAKMQYEAHKDLLVADKPLLSYALAAASLGAMLLAEVRTTYKVGERLEELDQKDKPQARLGVKFCIRYPRQAWWALSAMIAMPSVRTRTKALRAGRSMAHLRDRAKLNGYLKAEAHRALRAASKKDGTSEAILFRLQELAYLGLDGLGLQAQLASVAAEAPEAKADEVEPAQTEEAERPKAKRATASGPRPTAQGPAQTERPKADAEPKAEQPKVSFAEWAEAEGWAARPGGLDSWIRRVAFLASCYPTEVPPRARVIDDMKLRVMDPDQSNPEHSWTNKGHVGWALSDLKALRAEGYLDPVLDTETSDIQA